jgi:hypothetical protein
MKFIAAIFIVVSISLLWFANEILPKKVNYVSVVYEINSKFIGKMKKKHSLFIAGEGGGMPWDVKLIFLSFNLYHLVDIKEARKLIVDLVQEYLKEINTNKKIRPYLRNYPFTLANLRFVVFVFQKDGKIPPVGNIHCIVARKGLIDYELSVLPSDYAKDFPLLKRETLEEAMQILEEDSKLSTSQPISMFFCPTNSNAYFSENSSKRYANHLI